MSGEDLVSVTDVRHVVIEAREAPISEVNLYSRLINVVLRVRLRF